VIPNKNLKGGFPLLASILTCPFEMTKDAKEGRRKKSISPVRLSKSKTGACHEYANSPASDWSAGRV